jgi:hypothetical protein
VVWKPGVKMLNAVASASTDPLREMHIRNRANFSSMQSNRRMICSVVLAPRLCS